MTERGYTSGTVANMLTVLGHVGCWLQVERLDVGQLNEESVAGFLTARNVAGRRPVLGIRAMVPLLSFLREVGIIAAEQPSLTPLNILLGHYRLWLIEERGLAEQTVLRYQSTARLFLQEHAVADGRFEPAALTGVDVNAFLLRECARVSAGSAKGRVAELRSVLRFLYFQGITPMRLGNAVPPVGGWRLATLPPPAMSAADVQLLLDSCQRSTILGVRDFAMMMLIARLGFRSIEVARLELGDIDWRAGELVVRGKGGRQDRLPLPTEVGEAVVAYLSLGRSPDDGFHHLFLRCRAPRGPIRADLIGDVVERACKRAGLPRVGPHRLRHALAADLLRQGASLVAISQVLRHQDLATTALYAKVDVATLRACSALAGGAAMSALEQALADYLQLRRSLGHELAEAGYLLPGLIAYLDARGFARYLTGIDAATEVPPLGLMPHRQRWRRPFIYSAADIDAVMDQARQSIASPLRAATYEALIGLLAASGLRIGEVIKLDRADVDWAQGVLLIRESKFGKSRWVPLRDSSMDALAHHAQRRDELQPRPNDPSFFVSLTGKRLLYAVVGPTFRRLITGAGIGVTAPSPLRLHDLRHTFAVRTLLAWYREGGNVAAKIPSLSTYLGHREPASTYWYLSAAPELLALAAARQQSAWLAARP